MRKVALPLKKLSWLLALVGLMLCASAQAADRRDLYGVEPPVSKGYDLPYTLTVYIGNQVAVAYDGQTLEPVRYMICSTGLGNATPTGTFTMPATYTSGWDKWGTHYVRYPTTIRRPYYFHSILYGTDKSLEWKTWHRLGYKASAGCVRLTPLDAQWVNYNCKRGTRVRIVNAKAAGLAEIHDRIKAELVRNGPSSVQPTLSPTPSPPPPVLELGAGKSRVIQSFQRRLRQRGFYNGKLHGLYDGATVAAWNAYKKAKGWPEDGVATTEQQAEMALDDQTTAFSVDLKTGDTGPIVRKVEERLKALGYFKGTPNQAYDAATAAAVKRYQRARALRPTGLLRAVQQPDLFREAEPTPAPPSSP